MLLVLIKICSFLLPLALALTVPANGYGKYFAGTSDPGRSLNDPPPVEVRLLIRRGLELAENGKFREALIAFQRARTLAPNYLPAHLEYIRVKERIFGRFNAVEAEYRSLLQREPDNPVYLMANYFRYDGSLDRGALEKVARLAPEWAWGHYAKALLLEDREPEKAVAEYLKCIDAQPIATQPYYKLINLQTKLNRIDDAIATAEKFAAQPELRSQGLQVLWRLCLDKANGSQQARDDLKRQLQQMANASTTVSILAAVRSAYTNLLNDDESARELEAKIHKLDPAWYPTRGMLLSGPFFNISGIPRYIVLTNRQLALYNQTRELAENPDPRQRILRRERLLSLHPSPTLKRLIYEDIFKLAVDSDDAIATLKYARLLYNLDHTDTQVLAKAALVLAKRRQDLDQADRYARIAVAATAEFRPPRRPPNTPRKIFKDYFPEQKQRETYVETRATALHALALVFHQKFNDRQAEIALRKSIDAKPATARTLLLVAILRKLGRNTEADALAAKITQELGDLLARKFVNEPVANLELRSIDGSHYDLASLKGRVILINFWATWCGPCRQELPILVDLYRKYKDRGLEILSISTDDDPPLVSAFAREYKLTFPVFNDASASDRLRVESIPTTLFIGRDGIIHYRKVGFNEQSLDEIEAVINKLL